MLAVLFCLFCSFKIAWIFTQGLWLQRFRAQLSKHEAQLGYLRDWVRRVKQTASDAIAASAALSQQQRALAVLFDGFQMPYPPDYVPTEDDQLMGG